MRQRDHFIRRTVLVTALLCAGLLAGATTRSVGAQAPNPPPLGLVDINSLTAGGVSDPVIDLPGQQQLAEHVQRLAAWRSQAGATIAPTLRLHKGSRYFRTMNVPGNYNGISSNVGTALEPEPNYSPYAYYCGPGASRVVISNWTTNVPGIDTIATEEHTHATNYTDSYGSYIGTQLSYMAGPINNHVGSSFYINAAASSQGAFDNYVGSDTYTSGRPMITALKTYVYSGGDVWLNGWSTQGIIANHIVAISGFNFSNPATAGDNFYYQETSGTYAGTTLVGRNTFGANKMWNLVSSNNGQIW